MANQAHATAGKDFPAPSLELRESIFPEGPRLKFQGRLSEPIEIELPELPKLREQFSKENQVSEQATKIAELKEVAELILDKNEVLKSAIERAQADHLKKIEERKDKVALRYFRGMMTGFATAAFVISLTLEPSNWFLGIPLGVMGGVMGMITGIVTAEYVADRWKKFASWGNPKAYESFLTSSQRSAVESLREIDKEVAEQTKGVALTPSQTEKVTRLVKTRVVEALRNRAEDLEKIPPKNLNIPQLD